MAIQIERPITGYEVAGSGASESEPQAPAEPKLELVQVTEALDRPERLEGATYKVKPPIAEHALYITINDVVLNEGTEHEVRRPFEIFINSKNLDNFQWVVALTRVMSAVFRKGGNVTFLVDELKAVFDPNGGYWKPGGKFMPSMVAEIAEVVETHMKKIGLIESEEMDENQRRFLQQKRAEYESRCSETSAEEPAAEAEPEGGDASTEAKDSFPPNAQLCAKCHTRAVVRMDGCNTCLSCGDSKCG